MPTEFVYKVCGQAVKFNFEYTYMYMYMPLLLKFHTMKHIPIPITGVLEFAPRMYRKILKNCIPHKFVCVWYP